MVGRIEVQVEVRIVVVAFCPLVEVHAGVRTVGSVESREYMGEKGHFWALAITVFGGPT